LTDGQETCHEKRIVALSVSSAGREVHASESSGACTFREKKGTGIEPVPH